MPAEIVGEVIGGLFKVVGRIFFEVVIEIAIRGTGYLLCRPFNRRVDPDGGLVALIGIVFWIVLGILAYGGYRYYR